MKRSTRLVFTTLFVIAVAMSLYEIVLSFAYKRVEDLSAQYGQAILPVMINEVEDKKQTRNMLTETRLLYIKVFEANPDFAKVYVVYNTKLTAIDIGYVQEGRTGGFRYLRHQEGKWTIDTTKAKETVWSNLGVEDRPIWPPYY